MNKFTYDVKNFDHCPLDYLLEEVYKLGKINILTIGTGECAYFVGKQTFPKGQLNYSYLLEDKEIVFGDLSSLDETFSLLNSSNNLTVVVLTCIPTIMNLNIDYYIDLYSNLILINAPCFKKIKYQDLLSEFYYLVFQKVDLKIQNDIAILDYDTYSYDEFVKKLSCSTIIVNNSIFLKLCNYLKDKYHNLILDNTIIHDLKFYKQYKDVLKIQDNIILDIEDKLKQINTKIIYQVYTNYPSLSKVLNSYGIKIKIVEKKENAIFLDQLDAFSTLCEFVRRAYAIK